MDVTKAPLLTSDEAYEMMKALITLYWERSGRSSPDLAIIMSGFEEDPAVRFDWNEILAERNSQA